MPTSSAGSSLGGRSGKKVTISLRPETLAYVAPKARERSVSRPDVIDAALEEAEEREVEALMVAGYRAMARQNTGLAEESMDSFWEVIRDDGVG